MKLYLYKNSHYARYTLCTHTFSSVHKVTKGVPVVFIKNNAYFISTEISVENNR